jgi:hypothetical protein
MKILHISNFVQKHNGRLYWNHAFKINNGLIRNGHSVYLFSDRDISRSNILNKFTSNHYTQINLLETFKNYDPDLIIIGHADRIKNSTLKRMKEIKRSLKIIEWSVDNYFLDNTEVKLKKRSEVVDGIFITNADENIANCINPKKNFIAFFPNIFDESIENLRIFEKSKFEYDLFFALSHGVGSGKIKNNISKESNSASKYREEFLQQIQNSIPELKTNFYGFKDKQPIWGSEFEKQLELSPMSLNLSRKPHIKYYSSDRIAQYLGNGSAVFIDRASRLEDLFYNNEAFYYDDLDHLINLIKQLIKDPDLVRTTAYNGWKRGHKCYNDKIVTKFMIDATFDKSSVEISWPNIIY